MDYNDFGGNGAWWIIILFLFIFGGAWNGGNNGANSNYVLSSDFASLQRQIDNSTDRLAQQTNQIANGLSSLGYDQLAQMNGINTNVLTTGNAIQGAIANCCCNTREAIAGVNYNMATNTNALQSSIDKGFCQTNFNLQNATRDITENANYNTKSILDFLVQDKIQNLQNENNALRLQASQTMQNAYLISQLKTTTGTTTG